jgi:hypothetical protein
MRRDSLAMLHEVRRIRQHADAGGYDAAITRVRAIARHPEQEWQLRALDARPAIA